MNFSSKYSQLAKKSKSLNLSFVLRVLLSLAAFAVDVAEGVLARAAALDLDEVRRRENRPQQDDVQQILAVVAGGHHADRDADARLGADVAVEKTGVPVQVVVGETDGHLLGVLHFGSHLDGEIGVVLAGKHGVGQLVQGLGDPAGVVLA